MRGCGRALLVVTGLAVFGGAPSPAAATASGPSSACLSALETAYDGSTGAALEQLAAQLAARPTDLRCAYVDLLARAWDLEQSPEQAERDKQFHRRADLLIARCEARLLRDPQDVEARFVRGASWGVRSRLHLFRVQKGDAARTAVKMRADLLEVPEAHALHADALFGLGLYDYYADVLPRLLKLLRFLVRMPGGDRERGLEAIEEAERHAQLHHTEIQAQLFDIYSYYEGRHDDALERALALRRRYPGAPLWGLRLAEHQRERLGLAAESAATARELLQAVERRHPNYAPIVGLMARVSLGEALLDDLRPGQARAAVLPARDGAAAAPWIGARARLVLGRSLEFEGDREAALVHYRIAARSPDRALAARASEAQAAPLPRARVRAFPLLAEGRRAREAGRDEAAADAFRRALLAWPESDEARLRTAEADLAAGQLETARRVLDELDRRERPDPPWVKPWTRLLAARLRDAAGRRREAVALYNEVYQHPFGSSRLRDLASEGLKRAWRPPSPAPPSPKPSQHAR